MLRSLQLKDFRCFTDLTLNLDSPLLLIEGLNGSGKTSLFEALHYACYMRSFRALSPRDMIRCTADSFFIKIVTDQDTFVCGFTKGKRVARLNQQTVIDHATLQKTIFIVVTVTEDDLGIVKNEPERRRAFVDQSISLINKSFTHMIKKYRVLLDNRNAALLNNCSLDELTVWTEQLWHLSHAIEQERKLFLNSLALHIAESAKQHFENLYSIELLYQKKHTLDTATTWSDFESFWKSFILPQELRYKRTFFGVHLDDITITFQGKVARFYSSRGQQKLIVMLLKLALIILLQKQGHINTAITLLLDDFMTDFDHIVAQNLIDACLALKVQCFLTSPAFGSESFEKKIACERGALSLSLM